MSTINSEECEKKVQVVVRIRPQQVPIQPEQKPDNVSVVFVDNHRIQTVDYRNKEPAVEYEFEHVFGPSASQEDVYKTCVRPLLAHVLRGQNASVFAYGPTGSGKTYTMLGCDSAPGIIPRCVQDIFSCIEREPQTRYNVSYSYLEIYNEKVLDLLTVDLKEDLPIWENRDKSLFVEGLSEKDIKSLEEFKNSFIPASQNRATAATKMNPSSSRSHAVLLVKVLIQDMTSSAFRDLSSKIYFIDLAGSEDNRRTDNKGIRLRESGAINTSLFMLSEVVDALSKSKAFVPYRRCKLTRLLQDSLGGNSHSVMVIAVAPEERHYLNTLSTLKLARKAKKIVNTVVTKEIREEEPQSMNLPEKLEKEKLAIHSVGASSSTCCSNLARTCNCRCTVTALSSEVKKMKLELESVRMEMSARFSVSECTVSSCQLRGSVEAAESSPPLQRRSPRSSPQRTALADISSDSLFNSPLELPPLVKRGKKRSYSCAARRDSELDSEFSQPDRLRKRKVEVLGLLNGTLRELRTLQKIGEKKARLIYDWRALNGRLLSVSDLKKIAGFTGFKTFLQANLIELKEKQ